MSSQTKVFTKLIDSNKNVDYAISTVINEYDIKSAHASALYFIKGEDTYNELMKLDKLSRNTLIGKMIRDDPGSGVTHSLSHASASGVYVARHICSGRSEIL